MATITKGATSNTPQSPQAELLRAAALGAPHRGQAGAVLAMVWPQAAHGRRFLFIASRIVTYARHRCQWASRPQTPGIRIHKAGCLTAAGEVRLDNDPPFGFALVLDLP